MQTFSKHIKFVALLLGMSFCGTSIKAQRWQPVIYSGYITSSFDAFGDQHIKIADGRYCGFDVEYQLDKTFGIKITYGRQETNSAPPCCSVKSNTLIERYELGFTARNRISESTLYWTTGIGMGISRMFKQTDYPDELKLATSFNAGLNYHISRCIG